MLVLTFCVIMAWRPDDLGCRMVPHSGGLKSVVLKNLRMLFIYSLHKVQRSFPFIVEAFDV